MLIQQDFRHTTRTIDQKRNNKRLNYEIIRKEQQPHLVQNKCGNKARIFSLTHFFISFTLFFLCLEPGNWKLLLSEL